MHPNVFTGYWVWRQLPQAATSALPSYGWVYVAQPGPTRLALAQKDSQP